MATVVGTWRHEHLNCVFYRNNGKETHLHGIAAWYLQISLLELQCRFFCTGTLAFHEFPFNKKWTFTCLVY
jgi:hypothetical protein